jgi:hypothetical protein
MACGEIVEDSYLHDLGITKQPIHEVASYKATTTDD